MRCLNCGAEIDDESYMCPYCNKRIIDSIRKRRIEDISVYNRKMVIDEAFGFKINHDFHKLKLKELERYYNSLEKEYDHFGAQLQAERQKEICDHIESVYEKIQEAYPLRKGIQNPPEIKNKHFENNRELLNFLLDSCVPPQIHAAAFKLRSLSERSLRDHYCFEYG